MIKCTAETGDILHYKHSNQTNINYTKVTLHINIHIDRNDKFTMVNGMLQKYFHYLIFIVFQNNKAIFSTTYKKYNNMIYMTTQNKNIVSKKLILSISSEKK